MHLLRERVVAPAINDAMLLRCWQGQTGVVILDVWGRFYLCLDSELCRYKNKALGGLLRI